MTALLLTLAAAQAAQRTSVYVRPPSSPVLPLESYDLSISSPQQFRLAFSGAGMRLSWIDGGTGGTDVKVGTTAKALSTSFQSTSTSYKCDERQCGGPYKSGRIHSVHMRPLLPGTTYYYQVGDSTVRSFAMPPSAEIQRTPVQIGLIGDLGQTQDSNETVYHLLASDVAVVIHAGDLSYADCYQPRWDTYGQLVEPLAATTAWMTVAGNHEIESPDSCGSSLNHTFAACTIRRLHLEHKHPCLTSHTHTSTCALTSAPHQHINSISACC